MSQNTTKTDLIKKRAEFQQLYLTGKYTQLEIALKIGVSRATINAWVRDFPVPAYLRVLRRLTKELERLSQNPQENEERIFNYIVHLEKLETMIRKHKYTPQI